MVNYVAAPVLFCLPTPGDLAGILQQTGFVEIADEEFLAEARSSLGEEYFQSLMDIGVPIQNLFAKLSDAQKTEARGRIVASADQCLKANRVGLPIAVRMIAACTLC